MTDTRLWLERRRRELLGRETLAATLGTAGLVLAALALGVVLGRVGFYRRLPEFVLAGWGLALCGLGFGLVWAWRRVRGTTTGQVAGEIERDRGLRRGALVGLAQADGAVGSAALAALADRHWAAWLSEHGTAAMVGARARRAATLRRGAGTALVGGLLFVAAGVGNVGRGRDFWRPFGLIIEAHGPVALTVTPNGVRRGDSVTVLVRAAGRMNATLAERAPGEPWRTTPLALDSAGDGRMRVGPLDADRFFRATSGGRVSPTVKVIVSVPAFLSELSVVAKFPAYLDRPDEPLVGADTVALPVGTRVVASGRATVALGEAWWTGAERVPLGIDGASFRGALSVRRTGRWTLHLATAAGGILEDRPTSLTILAVADSAPVVSVPVPGADTTAPLSLKQPLVIDVRDDHRVQRVEVASRRASRLGIEGPTKTDTVPLPTGGVEQAILQDVLDLNGRGFLPGDTAYFRVLAIDDAPRPHVSRTREYALRLPSMSELRRAAREHLDAMASAADSLVRSQESLSRETQDLAVQRERDSAAARRQVDNGERGGGGRDSRQNSEESQLGYHQSERAAAVAGEQTRILQRARELSRRLDKLADQAWSAGLTDPAWQKQLADLRQLLSQAMTPALKQALDALQEAMAHMDAPAVRDALEQLARAQQQLREDLERSHALFQRAAIEGQMTTLANDASELAAAQRQWNDAAARRADSGLAASERGLAQRTDSLRAGLKQLGRSLAQAGEHSGDAEKAAAQAEHARGYQEQAAGSADAQASDQAAAQGRQASTELDPLSLALERQRDTLRQAWRKQVLDAMDEALVETAHLARQQEQINKRIQQGDASAALRSDQAAVRDGVDRVTHRLQSAAGRNALVSPRLGTALGFAKLKMMGVVNALQQANPNMRGAGDDAGNAVDALNAVASELVRSRGDVAGAKSGSGFSEAMERMAQLAKQQGGLNAQAGGLMPLMGQGGNEVLAELRQLAAQQRQLANELDRLRAKGQPGAGALAEEARQVARQLEAGVLDRRTIERQDELYHHLLDAGRTLRGNETDENKERVSESARPGNVKLPTTGAVEGGGPKYPYPSWDALKNLSPEQRRVILDYFRRLNDAHDHH